MSAFRILLLLCPLLAVSAFHSISLPQSIGLRRNVGALCTPALRSIKTVRKMSDEPIFEEEEPPKPKAKQGGLSDSMRQRLLKEGQSFGGDPNVASTNWVLVITGVIGVLAVGGTLFGAFGDSSGGSPF